MLTWIDRQRPPLAWITGIALAGFLLAIGLGWSGVLPESVGAPLIVVTLGALGISMLVYAVSFAASLLVTARILEASVRQIEITAEDLPDRLPSFYARWAPFDLVARYARSREVLLADPPGERRYQAARYRALGYSLALMLSIPGALALEFLGHFVSERLAYVGLAAGGLLTAAFILLAAVASVQGLLWSRPRRDLQGSYRSARSLRSR